MFYVVSIKIEPLEPIEFKKNLVKVLRDHKIPEPTGEMKNLSRDDYTKHLTNTLFKYENRILL